VGFDFRLYFVFGNNQPWDPPISSALLAPGPLVGGHRPLGDDVAPSRCHSVEYLTRAAPIASVWTSLFFSWVSSPCHRSSLCRPPSHSPFSLSTGHSAKHSSRAPPSSPLLVRAGRLPSVPRCVPSETDRHRSASFSPLAGHRRAWFHNRRVAGALGRLLLTGKLLRRHCLPLRHQPQLTPSTPCAGSHHRSP
jgi:hypothetical protein